MLSIDQSEKAASLSNFQTAGPSANWGREREKISLFFLKSQVFPEPQICMDYRPFIYGGLASMTAEFGKANRVLN